MPASDTAAPHTFDEACHLMIEVAKAAHAYGSTTGRIESFLSRLSAALGIEGTFRSTPTEIYFAFKQKDDLWQRTHLEDVSPPGQELNRLAALGELVTAVEAGQTSIAEANRRIVEIDNLPHPWGILLVAASFAVAGAGFAIILSGGIWDILFSGILSLVVLGVMMLTGRLGGGAAGWVPLTTALISGALAALVKLWLPELNLILVVVCSILVLVPGFPVSVGIIELVSNHVVSGMANLMNGLLYLVKQFAGAWLGVSLVALAAKLPEAPAGPSPSSVWLWVMLLPLLAALCFAMQTARRDFVVVAGVSGVTFLLMVLGGALGGSNVGNLMATIGAVVLSNLWSARTGRPSSIPLLPAIMLLVSGSIGFRGLMALAEGQVALGEQQFIQMFVVAITILAGLLVGNTLVRPKVSF